VAEARERAAQLATRGAELERAAAAVPAGPSLVAALRGEAVGVIAEVKRRSPSRGELNAGLAAGDRARDYASGGASAISVLTEPAHFSGSADDLVAVRAAVGIPVLKKDFHLHPLQVIEARALGASALLLIARALAPAELREMAKVAAGVGIEALVEVRDESELERALGIDATLVGVNNRNLETLAIDSATSARLIPLIPAGRIAIAESGVRSAADVRAAARFGADAVLVGSHLSASLSPADAVRELTGIPRTQRVR
jgi:indole-3-glycerol phosphate synthase